MRVYGEMIRAAFENLAADPSTTVNKFVGRVFLNTTLNLPKFVDVNGLIKPFKTDETTQQTIIQAAAAANITGMTIDSTKYTSKVFGLEISRGTTLFYNTRITLQYINSVWTLRQDDLAGEGDATDLASDLTFSQTGTTTTQIKVAAAANANNTSIKWKTLESYDA